MASMCNQWQRVDRSYVQENFMNGEYITSDTWKGSNPPVFYGKNGTILNYPYQKDSFTFSGNTYGSDIKHEINVTDITHATSCESAVSIIKDGGFRPGTKVIPGFGESNLIWFGLKVEEEQIDLLRRNYKQCASYVLQEIFPKDVAGDVADSVASEFANTTPFQPMSRYGNVKFTVSLREVLSQFKTQFCGTFDPDFRVLGTFAYKQEIMHVVHVCAPSIQGLDEEEMNPFGPIMMLPDGTWLWRPDSTGEQIISVTDYGSVSKTNFFKRWVHVTFAFEVPKGSCLQIDHLDNHVSLCLHQTKQMKIFGIHDAIIDMLQLIQREEDDTNRKKLANMLIFMIDGYRNEWPLYQKTVKLDRVIGDLTVQDEWVISSFRDMLPDEFEGLNWSHSLSESFNQLLKIS